MSRSTLALTVCALLAGCVVSFDGYRSLKEGGSAGTVAGSSGRGGTGKGGSSAEAGDGNAQGGDSAASGSSAGGDSSAGTVSGGTGGTGGSAGSSGSAGALGAAGSGEVDTCPDLRGQLLLPIPKPDGGIYCIDRTEVRNSDYAAFLADQPDTADQGAECAWNGSFAPETDNDDCPVLDYDPVNQQGYPVTCIDWCDAKKFCGWAGKELCGAIEGGPVEPESFADPALDAWFSACSQNGEYDFPYGDMYQNKACAGLDNDFTSPVAVGSLVNCAGGYTGLYDMSGNVSEWENSCADTAGGSDQCLHRGGDLFDVDITAGSGHTLRCNSSAADDPTPSPATYRRDMRHSHLGFRCCYTP